MSADHNYVLNPCSLTARVIAGGKAATLARLTGQFRIPDFFVIAASAFSEDGLKLEARQQVLDALAALGARKLAVRSSAVDEDGAKNAFAGQYHTELNVPSGDVFAAADRVWRSGFSGRAAKYRQARGLDASAQQPAVLVQKMLAPRAAGIAFSACPVSGDQSIAVINAVEGVADRLANGEVSGDTYNVKNDGSVSILNAERNRVLNDKDCRAVAELARACADTLGAPQDIEWAFEGEILLLLQSRPITTISESEPTIWDNSNIVESYPGVVSPLTFSFASYAYANVYRTFAKLMGVSSKQIEVQREVFDNMLGRIDGRVYYNLLNWYRVLAMFPGFQANRAFMEQMMGVDKALPPAVAERIAPRASNSLAKIFDQLKLARVGLGLTHQAFLLKRTKARFTQRLNDSLQIDDATIESMPAKLLVREYRRIEASLLRRWDAPLVNDFLCMIAFGAARSALEKWVGPHGVALLGDVLIGQGGIISAEPARRIKTMAAMLQPYPELISKLAAGDRRVLTEVDCLQEEFDAYLTKFGDRCIEELKLESRSLHCDPTPVLQAVAAAARRENVKTAQHPDSAAQLKQLLPAKPIKRAVISLLVSLAKARIRDRENLRFERTRLFGRARRVFRTLGERFADSGVLEQASDVFYLTVEEVMAAIESEEVNQLKNRSAMRRAEDRKSKERPDPPERIEPASAPTGVAAAVAMLNDDDVRSGIACCRGVVTARVRIITDPRMETLEVGEILVARFTDPGWIVALANAAGIITERGSLLSHSAIVAREMGVACVVGIKTATSWLKTGDIVRLDGGAGLVERIRA